MSSTIARAVSRTFAPIGARGSNQIECTQSKRYVGCHWNAPTVRTRSAQIEHQIDQSRHDHSPDCARDWKRGLLR